MKGVPKLLEIKIDKQRMEDNRHLFESIQHQIWSDRVAEAGESMHREDKVAAALVCMIVGAYEIVEGNDNGKT